MKNIKLGLTSVTFRQMNIKQVIDVCINNNLDYIEWGADIHIPAGEVEIAEFAKTLCDKNNLEIFSYGSYFKFSDNQFDNELFVKNCESCKALKAKYIRVWAGDKASHKMNDEYFKKLYENFLQAEEIAKKYDIVICTEYHSNTLCDNALSCIQLINSVKGIKTYWQPIQSKSVEENFSELKMLLPYIKHIHVTSIQGNKSVSFENCKTDYKKYIEKILEYKIDHFAFEFCENNIKENLFRDVKEFRNLLNLIVKH